MSKVNIEISSLEKSFDRFKNAWERAESGDLNEEIILSFDNFQTLMKVLNPRRLKELQTIRKVYPQGTSIRQVSQTMKIDYKQIHSDISALIESGLVIKENQKIRVPFDQIESKFSLT